jgi:predicted enzyme related to lactoylglutathione lyase
LLDTLLYIKLKFLLKYQGKDMKMRASDTGKAKLNIAAMLMGLAFVTTANAAENTGFAVGPQYDTTHVYVAPEDFGHFVTSFSATFGGTTSKQGVFQVTPTPSQTMSQLALTPAGTISVFGFKTPIPYPFGLERTGYLVNDFDKAIKAARMAGADIIVAPFPDPIGRDAIIQWPGGVNMQIYWHTTAPAYASLTTIPENRIYVSPDRANAFIQAFILFSKGKVISDNPHAAGIEIGRAGGSYRLVRIESGFGKIAVIVTDGSLPWPYGRELTGYEVADVDATLMKAEAAGGSVLVQPFISNHRISAIVKFPGGYIAEIHGSSDKQAGTHS